MESKAGILLLLLISWYLCALILNGIFYSSLENLVPRFVNSFIWASVFFFLPIGTLLFVGFRALLSFVRSFGRPGQRR